MSYPPPGHHNTFGGYKYSQQHNTGQQRQIHNDVSLQQYPGHGHAQRRVDALQNHALSTSLPTHQQHQPQANGTQERFYTAHSSPQLAYSNNQSIRSQTHAHPLQQHWQQAQPASHYQHAQQPPQRPQHSPYPALAFSQPTVNRQQGLQYGQTNQTYPLSQGHRTSYTETPVDNLSYTTSQPIAKRDPEVGRKTLLQPQSVIDQTRSQQPSAVHHLHPHKQQPRMSITPLQDHTNMQKRRKSNDGDIAPQSIHQSKTPQNMAPRSSTTLPAVSKAPTPKSKDDPELINVLLALADEYTTVAYSLAATQQNDFQQYHRLIATAIACLESALVNFRQQDPRQEAYIRLKLAALISEETDDTAKAEEILSKGIAACERARLSDLRYTMQHLSIRIMHPRVSKAAIKLADKMIAEVEALRLQHWAFVFRFLKFSISSDNMALESTSLLRQLNQLNELAKSCNTVSISCVTSCLEAMVSLRVGTTESLETAQRSLADVRSYQLNSELQKLPQLRAMISILDMAYCIALFSADQMRVGLQTMQAEQEATSRAKGWKADGSYVVSLGIPAANQVMLDAPGMFARTDTGELGMTIQWLTKGAMLTSGYVMGGLALLPRNGETGKSEVFFDEALKICNAESVRTGSMHDVQAAKQQQRSTRATIKMIMACTYAARAQYSKAIDKLHDFNHEKSQFTVSVPEVDRARWKFLSAACLQGNGQLHKALDLYKTWLQNFESELKIQPLLKDFQVLAILNSVHLARAVSPDLSARMESMLKSVEVHCLNHPNKAFASAYHVVESTIAPAHTTMMAVKKSLNLALGPAQGVKNKQLLSLIMNMMSETFFTDLVGSQAKSSSNAGRTLAKQSGDELWVAVGVGMLRDTLERSGFLEEARDADEQAQSAVNALPQAVKSSLGLG